MISEKEIIIGNLTTILMFVFSAVGGGAIIDVLGGTSQASILIGAILGLAYAILNAYFPNHLKILNNNKNIIEDVAESISENEDCECSEEEDDGGC